MRSVCFPQEFQNECRFLYAELIIISFYNEHYMVHFWYKKNIIMKCKHKVDRSIYINLLFSSNHETKRNKGKIVESRAILKNYWPPCMLFPDGTYYSD